MKQLTPSARKMFLSLVLGNLLLLLAFLQLGQYYVQTKPPMIPPHSIRSLLHLIGRLQTTAQMYWPMIIKTQAVPWSKITWSEKPLYPQNALLQANPANLFNLVKENRRLEASVFIRKNVWLNIEILSPNVQNTELIILIALILCAALFALNYWVVYSLNAPVQALLTSLNEDQSQEGWSPIPISGNADQKAILEKINRLQGKLSKLLSTRTQVVTAISHDLRTPLTRLKLRTEYLEQDANHQKILKDIHEMESMIRETLDYFQDVHREEKMQRFDLVALLNSLKEDALDLHHPVEFKSTVDKLIITGAVNLLKRAFNNIINNAVYYGQSAFIELKKHQDEVEISIVDTGPGLSEADLENAFNPFYRGENSRSRSTGGTGLGLTIAREIIQMHQGSILLSNASGSGLSVKISLPVGS
ncbi:sensor histidine kinase [Legionella jordanis]|uniref:histidine kinase n=1 Tax=Legionella jordanis TaxID=456 RepID=A0A0W0VC94_9GAMM|nr:HAMP domain-containing sensor histidine kinase [Legionella jordanis]KTD17746.1 sensor histidine kinase [Legionella jordanis]RMX01609.1 sensor histidine kinase [Legionella jordanis]RMX21605.1 sensor histidine kinase [Legionella jordanis]VEH11319.1 sensor histidine kinase [Legionella jordanis]HAT8714518.1 sensor histidine kinase [Legionella jordanis]